MISLPETKNIYKLSNKLPRCLNIYFIYWTYLNHFYTAIIRIDVEHQKIEPKDDLNYKKCKKGNF